MNINDVRQHLLDTLADLRNRENPMDVDRARAIAQVAGVLVDSAKVEVDFLKATGNDSSEFFGINDAPALPKPTGVPTAHDPFPLSRRHRVA
jgi:hypothetical protein